MTRDATQQATEIRFAWGRKDAFGNHDDRDAMPRTGRIRSGPSVELQSWPAAGGGLLICVVSTALAGHSIRLPVTLPSGFLCIGSDNDVRMSTPHVRLETQTARRLAIAAAAELGLSADYIELETAATRNDPRCRGEGLPLDDLGLQNAAELELRAIAALGRTLLVAAAAETWGVRANACRLWEGCVTHVRSDRYMRFGSLAADAALMNIPDYIALRCGRRLPIAASRAERNSAERSRGECRVGA